jgi:hypothetical protein
MSSISSGELDPHVFLDMENQERTNFEKAVRIICRDGRSYPTRGGKYVQMQVFSTRQDDVDLLTRVFGGNYYKHKSGWQWISSHKATMQRIRAAVDGRGGTDFMKRMRALYDCTPLVKQFLWEFEKKSIVS